MISRRHLVAAAPAALLLPGIARAAAKPLRLAMPMEIFHGATTVGTMINGKGPFRMLITPTVQLNQLSADLVPTLGLREMAEANMRTKSDAGEFKTKAYQADNIFIGGHIHEDNVSFVAAPRISDGIDGALSPWFAGFSASFDFAASQFIVLQGAPPTEGFSAVPFVGRLPRGMTSFRQHPAMVHFRSLVRLAGSVDGVPATFCLDTSMGSSVQLSSDFVRANGLWERYPKGESAGIHSDGVEIESRAVRFKELKIGDLTVAEPDGVLLHGAGMGRDWSNIDGYIGLGLLKRYALWIDWQAGFAYFKLNPAAAI
jgi:hypothetical protein